MKHLRWPGSQSYCARSGPSLTAPERGALRLDFLPGGVWSSSFSWRLPRGRRRTGAGMVRWAEVPVVLRVVLVRLLWFAVHPRLGLAALPLGWFHGRLETETAIQCGPMIESVSSNLEKLLSGQIGRIL